MKVTSLDGRQLRKMLRKEAAARCVVLDCRPYLAFAASSVRGSLNVNLNSVVLRRARGGAVSARYVLPDEAARARLLQEGGGGVAAVVVLDQGSRHWQKLREESAARVVLTSLLACLPAGPRVYFLKGERVGAADSLSPATHLPPRALTHPPRRRARASGIPSSCGTLSSTPDLVASTCRSLHAGFAVRWGGRRQCQRPELPPPHSSSSKAPGGRSAWVGAVGYAAGGASLLCGGGRGWARQWRGSPFPGAGAAVLAAPWAPSPSGR